MRLGTFIKLWHTKISMDERESWKRPIQHAPRCPGMALLKQMATPQQPAIK
jgi:hypothetical protein